MYLKKFIFRFLPLLIGLLAAIYFHSRAFSIGFIISIVGVFLISYKKNILHRTYLFIFLGLIVFLFGVVIFIKSDSSLGRVFIYKISTLIFRDNWFHGIGLGRFKYTYMYYQADYFKRGQYARQEFLLGDNTYFAFNDYFQFIIETGLLGIAILLLSFICLYKMVKSSISKTTSSILLNTVGLLTTLCIAACFTYVFYRLDFQIIALSCFTIIIYFFFKKNNLKTIAISLSFLLSLVIYFLGLKYVYHNTALTKLQIMKEKESAGYRHEALMDAKLLARDLGKKHEYLEVTSFIFTNAMMLKKAEQETKKLITIRPSSDAYSRLAYIYDLQNVYDFAEREYKMSINLVPNRFIPRYHLFKLLKRTGQRRKAWRCGEELLNMPVKVPSPIINQIKLEVKKEISIINANQYL